MRKPEVSVITPCYNDGRYLIDAVESVKPLVESGVCEHIVVDDGSDDPFTLEYYNTLPPNKVRLIYAGKVGLGKARNLGILAAHSEFYLNLDADNRILPSYPLKALAVMRQMRDIGVVYSNYKQFGHADGEIQVGEYNLCKLMASNYIDSCALIRRKTWEQAGGYDEQEMLWEDWNFWLSVAETNWRFHYINETLFEYRVRSEGSLRMTATQRGEEVERYIAGRHGPLFRKKFMEMYTCSTYMYEQIEAHQHKIAELESILLAISQSSSWRLTAPLRRFRKIWDKKT